MNNKLFSKGIALAMGSLVIFSGQALALSSNKREFTSPNAYRTPS